MLHWIKTVIKLSTGKSLYYISTQPFPQHINTYKVISQGNGKLGFYNWMFYRLATEYLLVDRKHTGNYIEPDMTQNISNYKDKFVLFLKPVVNIFKNLLVSHKLTENNTLNQTWYTLFSITYNCVFFLKPVVNLFFSSVVWNWYLWSRFKNTTGAVLFKVMTKVSMSW